LDVGFNENLTKREKAMACKIFNGKPTSVALAHIFGNPEEHRLHWSGPRETRIEGKLCLTQEQLPLLEEIMVSFAAMLKDHAFRGAIRTTVGASHTGTDQRLFPFSASANREPTTCRHCTPGP
jgi:hypothetical protein